MSTVIATPATLMRLATASSRSGIPKELLESAVRAGQIPGCEVVTLGARNLKHLRGAPRLFAWVANPRTFSEGPAVDCLDLFFPS